MALHYRFEQIGLNWRWMAVTASGQVVEEGVAGSKAEAAAQVIRALTRSVIAEAA